MRCRLLLPGLLGLLSLAPARAQSLPVLPQNPPALRWQQVRTPHFRVIYAGGIDSAAQRTAARLEQLHGPGVATLGHCGAETANAKYCSRSCANRVNGHLFPSRQRVVRNCKHCGTARHGRRTSCDDCNPGFVDWRTVSLQALKAKALQQYAAQIRSLAV